MNVKAFRHLWGIEGAFERALPKIRTAGYEGIEFSILKTLRDPFIRSFIRDHKMDWMKDLQLERIYNMFNPYLSAN